MLFDWLRAKLDNMEQLRNKRAIVDRIDLQEQVEAVLVSDLSKSDSATTVLDVYRAALASGNVEIRRRFEEDQHGEFAVEGHCFLIDQLIRVMHDLSLIHI